jgi:hypothetical protein
MLISDISTTLKLIQHIQNETLVTGCTWLDKRRAVLGRTFGQQKERELAG